MLPFGMSVFKRNTLYHQRLQRYQRIKNDILSKFDVFFAPPEFSADNAAGVAYLGAMNLLMKD